MLKTHPSDTISDVFPELWYDIVSIDHFWFYWRYLTLLKIMKNLDVAPGQSLKALDIGSGNGLLIQQLEKNTKWVVDGCDINPRFVHSIRSRGHYFQYNIFDRDESMKGQYDIVFLFDILEHLSDPKFFLECSSFYVKKGGVLVINVPAFMVLYGAYDRAVGHLTRYTKRTLHPIIDRDIFEIQYSRYWGLSISSLVAMRKALDREGADPQQIIRRGMQTPPAPVNYALRIMARIESVLLPDPPAGCSLMVALTKR